MGIRHQPDPKGRPEEADWVCRGLIMPLCMSTLELLVGVLVGRRWALATIP